MQLTTFTLSALCIGSTLAQEMVKTHVVRVGAPGGGLTYSPNDMKADVGDMVQFQFMPKNHTVTQSTFDQPCQPIGMNSNVTGIYSGFIAVAADAEMTATYTIRINDTKPLWLYCSQGSHCQGGMVMVINAPAANRSRTLAAYQDLAKAATVNLPGDAVSGGGSGSTPSNNTDNGSGSGSGSGSGAETSAGSSPTGADATPTSSAGNATNTGAASMLRAGEAMGLGGLVALGMALLV